MADAFSLAEKHLVSGLAEATNENVDINAYGQALVWKLIEKYKENGRSQKDIRDEISYTLDNIDDDGTFHVSRN